MEDIQQSITRKICLACNREFTGLVAACPHDGTVLIPLKQDQLIGTKLAERYLVLSVIGHGGMGVVYKAKHELMDRLVAIKMLQSQLISDSLSVKRFQQEAKAASRLNHPHVITLYDFGVSPNGQPYLVMDYLVGTSLAQIIKAEGQLGVERCQNIFKQACSALDHAHKQGVIHRDLKPGNIMLTEQNGEQDFVKVVDFGVAKLMPWAGDDESQRLTQTGEVCGSPVYMSPEQCMGQKLDARSDIYTMGVVIYEALTGRLPLLGRTMVDTMSKHISEMPVPFKEVRPDLYIPERLESVVFKALQKKPEDRQQSMEQLHTDLEVAIPKSGRRMAIRASSPSDVPVTVELPKPKEPKQRVRNFVLVLIGVLLLLGGTIFWMFLSKPASAPVPAALPPTTTVTPKLQPSPSPIPTTAAPKPIELKPSQVNVTPKTPTIKVQSLPTMPPHIISSPPITRSMPKGSMKSKPKTSLSHPKPRENSLKPQPSASIPTTTTPKPMSVDDFKKLLLKERSYGRE